MCQGFLLTLKKIHAQKLHLKSMPEFCVSNQEQDGSAALGLQALRCVCGS